MAKVDKKAAKADKKAAKTAAKADKSAAKTAAKVGFVAFAVKKLVKGAVLAAAVFGVGKVLRGNRAA